MLSKASDTTLLDPSLVDIAENAVPSGTPMEEYGYESDSDLGDEEPPPIVVDAKDQADTMESEPVTSFPSMCN